jgi:hypothetical protein
MARLPDISQQAVALFAFGKVVPLTLITNLNTARNFLWLNPEESIPLTRKWNGGWLLLAFLNRIRKAPSG